LHDPQWAVTVGKRHVRHGLAAAGKTVTARPVFERTFREYGLPIATRTDNGVPFTTQAIHGLSYLNVW
jgi:hypothetical protein